ncbi:hypothetical protein [Lentibacillus sp. CBA3610]|uniref:hypothetical protein n=1 Tax=Lentibacillus sp. CBA3610 TaxID=2518176 RepID=UPI001595B80D|nr:hypothetical protein [Lentibacillus sp. CBA3610]QKY71350.1 hypothetical protein Len3610_18935 [Lentibacillus sp. CBA3610]
MEKRVLYKFTFLIIVALLIIAMYVWKWTTDDEEKQNPEDLFDESQQETEQPPTLQEDKIDEVLGAKPDSNAEDETQNAINNNGNQQTMGDQHEATYQNKFGDQAVTSAKEQAKQGLALYLSQIADWDKWEGVVTSSFLQDIKQTIPTVKEANVERRIESIELFASNTSQSNNMAFGAFATWHVTSNERLTNQRTQLFYLTMVQQNDQWLMNNIETPDEGMEGKKDT